MIWNPAIIGLDRPVYYCDFLDMLPDPPDPDSDEDGIHLNYFRAIIPPYTQVLPTKVELIEEYIDVIIDEFHLWKNHPFKLNLCIPIANILMSLGRRNEAKEFYKFFVDSGVSSRQFASWINDDIEMLKKEFEGEV